MARDVGNFWTAHFSSPRSRKPEKKEKVKECCSLRGFGTTRFEREAPRVCEINISNKNRKLMVAS